jgi:branched-chain amino acid transport system ATP-binding protein
MLKVSGLRVAYGGIQAVKGISFEVREGELVSLIGANGAGKTTTLKAITGTQSAAAGEIEFIGRNIKGQGPWDLVRQGLVMVPEGRGVFARMTITENLQMGAFVRDDEKEIAVDIDKVFEIFPRLKERRHQLAGTMSGGEQQMLAMGRALMAKPKVLLMDEPSMGCRRSWSTRSSRSSTRSTSRARRCCWSSRTRAGLAAGVARLRDGLPARSR